MEELKRKGNLPVQATTEGNILMLEFDNVVTDKGLQLFANQIQEMFERMQASNNLNTEKTHKKIEGVESHLGVVENKVEQKEISSDQLDALTDLVKKKATAFVTKRHVQLNIDMYESNDFNVAYQELVKKQIAKVCRQIWRELKSEKLNVSPSKFKNRKIKKVDVDGCFDFVRLWGGFSV